MCGIAGITGHAPPETIHKMVAAMGHRGPDDSGVFVADGCALGHARLSIIDLSPHAHQPMANADGSLVIVYNGETYNSQKERALLEQKGHRFSSQSDTEVVLRLYEEYGDDFLLRLRGMFALAIYDKRRGPGRERMVLARDHLGIKPLLFARVDGRLVFASEMKALLASGLILPRIDPVALRLLLTFGSVYQPRTMLQGVNMLLPAHRMIIEQGHEHVERYWSLGINRRPDLQTQPYEVLIEEVAEVLKESVSLQLVSDVPLGAFLSGGVDSSILVAMMSQAVVHRVKTFSVGFEVEGADIDESQDAERTARFLGTDHTHVLVKGTDVRDRIQHIASALDQPSVNGVNSYFISLAARQGVTVAISGTGGDEIFAGYPWFINMVLHQQRNQTEPYKAMARTLLASVARQPVFDPLLLMRGGERLYEARICDGFVAKYATNYQIFGPLGAAKMLCPDLKRSAQAGRSAHYDLMSIDELSGGSAIERVTGLCLRGYTNNQLLRDIDSVSMAHSLEVRVPYLDHLVVDVALSLPDSAKLGDPAQLSKPGPSTYRETGAKRILIDVGRPLLPKDFDLQPKRGFGMPFDTWLRGPLRDILLDTLSERAIQKRGFLDVQEASVIRKDFLEGRLSWAQPWLLMMLELWCREVIERSHGERDSHVADNSRVFI
jgi:asparagine synthase (glutamine-hydrolysing)